MTGTPLREVPTWLEERTILHVRHGSHAFGTAIATSDQDFVCVVIPPMEYVFGCSGTFSSYRVEEGDTDTTYYGVQEFCRLAVAGDPTIVEALFMEGDNQIFVSEAGQKLLDARDIFLTKLLVQRCMEDTLPVTDSDAGKTHTRVLRRALAAAMLLEHGHIMVTESEQHRGMLLAIRERRIPMHQVLGTYARCKQVVDERLGLSILPEVADQGIVDRLCRNVLLSAFNLPKNNALLLEAVTFLERVLPVAAAYPSEIDNTGWILDVDAPSDEPSLHWAEDVDGETMACGFPIDPLTGTLTLLSEVRPKLRRICPTCDQLKANYQPIDRQIKAFIDRVK